MKSAMNDPIATGRPGRTMRCTTMTAMAVSMTIACASAAHAATSVMIWPIDPVIESDQRASALWLENQDVKPVTLQIRVLAWREADWKELHAENQRRIVSSPPMATVLPGKRQLIRLTKLVDAAPGTEEAYRVLIDEIPQAEDSSEKGSAASLGVRFQMHYSIPLFVYGNGIWTKEDPDKRRDPATASVPLLGWHITHEDGKRWLVVANRGVVHARITQIAFESDDRRTEIEKGLLGYVLPGAQMRWPLPQDLKLAMQSNLVATVNGKTGVEMHPDSADMHP
ncbi:fimbrial biogenesis chaperone [Burkholderia stabilis]